MAALREENARLEQICREQNYELAAMQIGIEELRRASAEMVAKRDALRAQRRRDLHELRSLGCHFWQSDENLMDFQELPFHEADDDAVEGCAAGGVASAAPPDGSDGSTSDGSLYD